jgi:acetyltransferase-like isoleucine patch superfamily enzyme
MTNWRAWQARRWLQTCTHVGVEPRVVAKPTIYAEGELRIGDRFYLTSRPIPSHLVVGPRAALHIGDDVAIGHGAAIAAYERVQIGSGTRIGPFVILMDTNFHRAGDQSLQHDTRPVIIGAGCRIGSRVTITRGVTIGDGAEILAGSVVSAAVPAGACVAGARARVIGRAGDMAARWESPAARLPELLRAALELKLPPDLDDNPMPAQLWTDERVVRALQAIKDEYVVAMDARVVRDASSYADIARALNYAVAEQRSISPAAGA